MSLVDGFEAVAISGRVSLTIEALSPLTIGSGKSAVDPLLPDIPLLRDSGGRPLIPGSTLKGFVRSGMERILSALGVPNFGAFLEDLMGKTSPEAYGSRAFFTDARVQGGYEIGLREHVALNPSTMAVRHGPFKQEYVEPGAIFRGEMAFRNMPPSFLSLLQPISELAELGVLRLGRSKSRGYGHVRLRLGNPVVSVPWPPSSQEVRLQLRFVTMSRNVLVTAEKVEGGLGIKDDLSNCEIVGKLLSGDGLLLSAELDWAEVARCSESLLRGLKA